MNDKPIGIFDSGLGGLTVLKEVKRLLSNESLIYLGDTARVPYGTRSEDAIIKFSLQDVNFLIQQQVKAIVIACNTSSSYAYTSIKNAVDVPVFDVISSGVDTALATTRSNQIGVIGTRATILSDSYQSQIKNKRKQCMVYTASCPLFVPLIEEGEIEGEIVELITSKYLSYFKKDGLIDTLILGCTHYPIISSTIHNYLGSSVNLVNSGASIAEKLKKFLNKNNLTSQAQDVNYKFFVTDLNPNFKKTAKVFLEEDIDEIFKIELD